MKDSAARALFSPSSIRSRLQQDQKDSEPGANGEEPGAEAALPDKVDPLPVPDRPYKAHSRHSNKPETTIFFVTRDFSYEGFSYADLERVRLVPGDRPGSGPVLILRFNGSEVEIEGRHLRSLCNWIGLHLVPWVWEHPSPGDFSDENAAVIRGLTFRQIDR